jgi:death on curing protein
MRYLTLSEVLDLYSQIMERSGGAVGIRDIGALESALAQPHMTFGGQDLYPTLGEKAAALGYLLIMNHPFVDGYKRTGHAAVEVFLLLNGFEICAAVDEQEQLILRMAAGETPRTDFSAWLRDHIQPKS